MLAPAMELFFHTKHIYTSGVPTHADFFSALHYTMSFMCVDGISCVGRVIYTITLYAVM